MNIEDIQNNFRISTEVSVILGTGQQFCGTLVGISESSITLRQSSGNIVLSVEAIVCVSPVEVTELTNGTAPRVKDALVSPPPIPPLPLPPVLSTAPAPVVSETTAAYPLEVLTQVVKVATQFGTAIQQVNLEPLPPDFALPNKVSSLPYSQKKNKMQGEWNKLQSQYDYAIKVKEFSRINVIIRSYEQLLERYPELASAARFNIGCLHLDLGRASEALKTFELAAIHSRKSRIFYNLAVVAFQKKDTAKSCYALQEFFKLVSVSQHIAAWHKFLGLALDFGIVSVLTDLIKPALYEYRSKDVRLILESAVFVLKSNDRTDDAHELMAFLLQENWETDGAIALLETMLSRLNIKPTETYRKQQEKLLESARQMQETKEKAQRQKKVRSLLSSAEQLAKRGTYPQAIAEVRKALQLEPENTRAKQLETEYRDADRERGLPTGNSSYAQAKRAQIIEQDFPKAERLYRQAIKKGDKAESAVNDLASLLQQQNKDEEAIQLLRENQNKASNKQAIGNMLATAYQRVGKYPDEIACLQKVLALTSYEKRTSVLKRIALAQLKLGKYKQSEDTLARVVRQDPRDEIAQRWLTNLREGKQTGIYTELDALFLAQEGIADAKGTLSEFIAFHVERCDYAGVEAPKKASKQFTDRDVEKLDSLADRLGTERPRERASYYLSAAKMLMDMGVPAEERRPRAYLRNFCAAMGDACIAEQKNKDVARSYYAEAFLIAPDWVRQLEVKLSQYIMLYHSPDEEILKPESLPTAESCLEQALKIQHLGKQIIEGLLYLSLLNNEVTRVLINKINPNKRLRESVQSLCYQVLGEKGEPTTNQAAFLELWERGRDFMRRRNQDVEDAIAFLNSVASGLDDSSLLDQIERVQTLAQRIRGTLDRQRLNSIKEILSFMYDYSQQQTYMEREYFATIIKNRVTGLIEEIERNPTKYSWELFRPYSMSLGKTVEEYFTEVQQTAEPEQLKTELCIDSYTPDSESKVECQITITNEQGKSPASSITIKVEESPSSDYIPQQQFISVMEALPGEQSVTCPIPVVITEEAKQSKVFTLYYQLSYTTRTGRQIQTNNTQAIRLYSAEDFKEIDNLYATYAQGSTVEDEKMFYGRDQLIDKLLSAIRNASSAKSLVIYGQKRAGKSSVLYHLKRQLQLPIIPVSFSIGTIMGDFSVATFLYLIIQSVEEALEELANEGHASISVQRPILDELEKNPQLKFQDYMSDLRRTLRQTEEYRDARMMLLIDEFSYIYGEIMRGRVQDTFMKSWKALLEKRYFGAVLVGQDVMPQFIERFPNDFQVAESQRVSYLAPEDARKLIVDPIRIPQRNESRYKGEAVKRLIELTAGSPYYIQIFCNRLVDYMNRKKAIYVTDADIERVKEDLIGGHNSLTGSEFDNLTSAGDSSSDGIPKEDAEAVLRDISNGSRIQPYCDHSAIMADTSVPVDKVLDDLVRREVVDKYVDIQGTSRFRIRVSLFKEWLLAHQ